eukprot:2038303-Pleurochrysis_carterae.AAC.2
MRHKVSLEAYELALDMSSTATMHPLEVIRLLRAKRALRPTSHTHAARTRRREKLSRAYSRPPPRAGARCSGGAAGAAKPPAPQDAVCRQLCEELSSSFSARPAQQSQRRRETASTHAEKRSFGVCAKGRDLLALSSVMLVTHAYVGAPQLFRFPRHTAALATRARKG